MIKKASEISLKVRPIALTIEHRYYYEGSLPLWQR